MIYLDSSVALSHLLSEDRSPSARLAHEHLVSSRLLEYEIWNRIHARGLTSSHGHGVRELLAQVEMVELTPTVLVRALDAWPLMIRTLDGLHLATIEYLRAGGTVIQLASYDTRLLNAARALEIPIYAL